MSGSLFAEIRRRNVFKVGAAYLVLTWIIVQITALAVPALHLPLMINTLVFFLALLGFPIVLFFAWAFEMTPQGIKRGSQESSDVLAKAPASAKFTVALIPILIIVAAYFIYESRFTDAATAVKQADKSVSGASVAVLPFVNMSSDSEQEYFSDGISEEILNVLAQVPKLHVTSRSSSFAFKGKDINLAEVATTLGVDNILEGSVRKSGDKIRITAQLIQAAEDKHLWSATYDRELLDTFAVQDEISAAIVIALKEKLGLNAHIPNRETRHINLDAHNEYLKGRYFMARRTQADIETALAHFIKATELAPLYAPAWTNTALAQVLLTEFNYGQTPYFIAFEQANIAVDKALAINPALSAANAVKGVIHAFVDEAIAERFLTKAIRLDGSNAEAHTWLGRQLQYGGQYEQSLLAFEKAVKLDPLSVLTNANYADSLARLGYFNQAEQQVVKMATLNTNNPRTYVTLASIRSLQNRQGEAAWLQHKSLQLSQGNVGAIHALFAALTMLQLNLGETAASMLATTPFGFYAPLMQGQWGKHAATMHAIFPRADNDMFGFQSLGFAEVLMGEYAAAVSWFDKNTFFKGDDTAEIYSYLKGGDETRGNQYLTVALAKLTHAQEIGLTGYAYPDDKLTSLVAAELSYLQGDTDKAIAILETAIDGGAVLDVAYRYSPMYEALRAHPDWPALLVKSELTVVKQKAIYWQLSQQDATVANVLARPM
jgi:TolB-like protein